MGIELRQALRRAALARGRAQIEKPPAADRALARRVPQHEAVAGRSRDRAIEHDLDPRAFARRNRPLVEQNHPSADFRGRMMQSRRHPLRDRLRLRGEHAERRIDAFGRGVQFGIEHHVAAMDGVLGDAVAGEIERAALAGLAALGRPILRVDRANARSQARRADRDVIADADRSGQHRAGDDGADAGQRE